MIITFIPCTVIGSGYAGKSGAAPLYKGTVARALREGALTFDQALYAEKMALAAFVQSGNFPGYFPTLERVDIEVI